jgi:hypothetical protein
VLRDLFLEAKEPRALIELARLLLPLQPEAPELRRLFDGDRPDHIGTLPDRLRALLAAGHPQAVRYLLQRLEATPPSLAEKAQLLRSFRLALRPLVSAEQLALLPEPLAAMFR